MRHRAYPLSRAYNPQPKPKQMNKGGTEMSIGRIVINDYKKRLGGSADNHSRFVNELPRIIGSELTYANIQHLDLYNLEEERHKYEAGRQHERIVIFSNATAQGADDTMELISPEKINGIENTFTRFLSPKGNGILIASEHGIPLAEWHEDTHELNILFDLFRTYNRETIGIFTFIMKEFNQLVWFPKTLENSWKHSQDKVKLTDRFTDAIKRQKEARLQQDIRQANQWENELNEYRRRIKQVSDNLIQKRRQVAVEQESIKNVSEGLIKDLDLIIGNEKIDDLHIKDGKFVIYTKPLYIYSDKGRRYYGGKYTIELNPENSDVRFFGDNPRQGFWTPQDPHPHVSGRDGTPCFGNVSSTIAELCSQMQIYALTMVCIDFLESANTADVAGGHVHNWDEVDEEGNIISTHHHDNEEDDENSETLQCQYCDERVHPDTIRLAYNDIAGDGEVGYYVIDEIYVCENCLENEFHYNEDVEEYIRN